MDKPAWIKGSKAFPPTQSQIRWKPKLKNKLFEVWVNLIFPLFSSPLLSFDWDGTRKGLQQTLCDHADKNRRLGQTGEVSEFSDAMTHRMPKPLLCPGGNSYKAGCPSLEGKAPLHLLPLPPVAEPSTVLHIWYSVIASTLFCHVPIIAHLCYDTFP